MIKTKDGYAKLIGTTYSGSVSRVLLSNGGDHILGNSNGNIPLNNGTVNTNLNADMLDGLHIHAGRNNEANKIVRTDASGYIQAGWINTTSGNIGTGTINKIYCSNDDYIRYKTPANFFETLSNDGNQISITIGSQNRKLTVNYASFTKTLDKVFLPSSTSNAANTAWCKFARITFNNSAWSTVSGYLFFGGCENPDNRAILVYHFRSGNTATTLSAANLYWLVKSYSNAIVIAVKVADNVYDLYTNNSGTYQSPCIYHMSAFSNKFTWSVGNWTTTKPTAAYTSSDIGIVNYANSASNADTLDNYHASGLLTDLSNSNNGVSITVGGTTKNISNISVNYANSSGYAKYLNSVNRMDYGWNGINYFNANLTAGCAAKVNDSPTSTWWHILRFNHNNSSGYYTDLAVPFNSNSLYWKTVRKGTVAYDHWIKVLDSLNYNEFAPTKTGVGASGTWNISISGNAATATTATKLSTSSAGSASLPVYFSNGIPVACTKSSIFSNLSNNGDQLSITVAGYNRLLTVAYASRADSAIDADYASSADWAEDSLHASSADSATNADYATNADTLDGHHAYEFALSGHTHTLKLESSTKNSSMNLVHGGKYELTAGGNSIIFTLPANNNTAHTTFTWTNGSTAGPTGSLSGNHTAVSFPAIPSATASISGIVTTGTQTFAGNKTFNGNITLEGGYQIKRVGCSVSWSNGRNSAIVRQTTASGYSTVVSSKTTNGSWEMGNYTSNGDSLYFTYISDSNYNSGNNAFSGQIYFNSTGSIYANHFYESSDIRYKRILRNLSINSNTIANLPLFDFEWIENNAIGTGTSAQAVQQILPNLVFGTDKLTLDYGVLGTIAGITACKELVTQKSELQQLKEKVKQLEDKLSKYENTL